MKRNQLETYKLCEWWRGKVFLLYRAHIMVLFVPSRPASKQHQSNMAPHPIYVVWCQSCITPISQCVKWTLGTNLMLHPTALLGLITCANWCYKSETLHLCSSLPHGGPLTIEEGHCSSHDNVLMGKWFPDLCFFFLFFMHLIISSCFVLWSDFTFIFGGFVLLY